MNALEQIATGWQALRRTALELANGALWAPWLLFGAVQLATLAALWGFAHPAVSWWAAPLIERMAGERALHYPDLFRALAGLQARLDVFVGAVAGSIAVGASTVLFAARFRGLPLRAGEALRAAGARSGTLVLAHLPFNAGLTVVAYGLEWLVESRSSSGVTRRLVFLFVLTGSVVLQAAFFYVGALVMLEGRNAIEAWRALPRTWSRGYVAALVIGAVMVLPLVPFHQILLRGGAIVERGNPELIGVVLALQIVVGLGVWFLLAGGATLVYLSAVADADRATGRAA